MDKQSEEVKQLGQAIERRIGHLLDRLAPLRDGLFKRQLGVKDIEFLSSDEKVAVLLAARRDHELQSPVIAFMRLDEDMKTFVILSRERPEVVGARIAANI
jgi:hypothetical protein